MCVCVFFDDCIVGNKPSSLGPGGSTFNRRLGEGGDCYGSELPDSTDSAAGVSKPGSVSCPTNWARLYVGIGDGAGWEVTPAGHSLREGKRPRIYFLLLLL